MARRKQKHLVEPRLLLRILATVFCLWAVINVLNNLPNGTGAFFVFLVVAAGAIIIVQKVVRPGRRRQSLLGKAIAVVDQQTDELVRRRTQLVRQDAYGKWQLGPWFKEIEYFITYHIGPSLTIKEQSILERERTAIARMVAERIETVARDKPAFKAF